MKGHPKTDCTKQSTAWTLILHGYSRKPHWRMFRPAQLTMNVTQALNMSLAQNSVYWLAKNKQNSRKNNNLYKLVCKLQNYTIKQWMWYWQCSHYQVGLMHDYRVQNVKPMFVLFTMSWAALKLFTSCFVARKTSNPLLKLWEIYLWFCGRYMLEGVWYCSNLVSEISSTQESGKL